MEKEVKYEVCRLHNGDVDDCVPHIHLGFHAPDNRRTSCPHSCNHRRLLHDLAMPKGTRQGGQSNGGIPVQESRIASIFLLDGRIMGTHYHIQSGSCSRKYPDRNSTRILGSAVEQHHCIEKVTQEELCVG